MSTTDVSIITSHIIAKEFFLSLSKKWYSTSFIPVKSNWKNRFLKDLFSTLMAFSSILCVLSMIAFTVVVSIIDEDNNDSISNPLAIALAIVTLLLFMSIAVYILAESKISKFQQNKIENITSEKLLNRQLRQLREAHPEVFEQVQHAMDYTLENSTIDNFIVIFYSNILTKLMFEEEEESLQIEKLKRLILAIAHGNFIFESLDLQGITNNPQMLDSLLMIFEGFKEIEIFERNQSSSNSVLWQELDDIVANISHIEDVITILKETKSNDKLIARISSEAEKVRQLTKDEPVAKTNLKGIKSSKGIDRDTFLATMTALDDELVEIRTRAGTYYASISSLQNTKASEKRQLELLTDRELEMKVDVINSTLELLEAEKDQIPQEEYETIKSEQLSLMFKTKQTLQKRTVTKKKIICPNCSHENLVTKDECSNCGIELPYCIVCLSSLGVGEEISKCPHCESYAHSNHLEEWLEKTDVCPYCKQRIKQKKIKREKLLQTEAEQ